MSAEPKVVVVNDRDEVVGAKLKKNAIKQGLIHRIARIFVFNQKGELYLQQRGGNVHFPNLWDQSVGGHVDEGETYELAAHRESQEELHLTELPLKEIATYFSEVKNPDGVLLRRFNRLFSATTSQKPRWDPSEVQDGRWVSMDDLNQWIKHSPGDFTGTGGFLEALKIYQEKTSG